MFDHPFWHYSGLLFWTVIAVYVLLRLIFGKNWLLKIGLTTFLGPGLKKSLRKLFNEYPSDIKKDTLADVATNLVWRFTRLGLLGLLIAGLPIWLLLQQNSILKTQNKLFALQNEKVDSQLVLFSHQNKRIDEQTTLLGKQTGLFEDQNQKIDVQTSRIDQQIVLGREQNALFGTQNERLNLQNNLIEADRRSSLVFLMSNVLDKVDEEIKEQRDSLKKQLDYHPNSIKFRLSKPLVARIVALSRAFRPYRIMESDTLSTKLVSPERGQLFIALMESNLDSTTQNTIVESGDFSYAIIGQVRLAKADLYGSNLSGADLRGADFHEANLRNARFRGTNLRGANLGEARLRGADLIAADFRGIFLNTSNLRGADLSKAGELSRTDLSGADLSFAYLSRAYLDEAILTSTDLSDANLSGASLNRADLSDANLSDVDLSGASLFRASLYRANLTGVDLSGANLYDVRNITLEQLKVVHSLFGSKNLYSGLEKKLRAEKPCLFTEEGCR